MLAIRRARRGRALAAATLAKATPAAFDAFLVEQELRVRQLLGSHIRRCRHRLAELRAEDERATKYEAQVSFDVEVRGACGSDAHPAAGE
jgi:hypothetical protein